MIQNTTKTENGIHPAELDDDRWRDSTAQMRLFYLIASTSNAEQRDSVPPPASQQSPQIYNGKGSFPAVADAPVGEG